MKIFIAESLGFSPLALGILQQAGHVELADADMRELRAKVRDADALWVRLRNRIDASVMDAAPNLKIIATPTTGLNHIDMDEAERRGIRVLSLRDAQEFLRGVRATAEHTVALTLALLRNIPASFRHVRFGGWNRDQFKGRELYGKTVGIVGYGRLGRIVARYMAAFDTCVLATDPNVRPDQVDPGVRMVSLSQLLRDSDIVTLHVNLTPQTERLFSVAEFAAMRRSAWFINTARGELVEERALLEALRSGWIAGAAVDVVCGEQAHGPAHSPLLTYARRHDNLIVTPHLGGCTVESMEKTEIYLSNQLVSALAELERPAEAVFTAGS
jgi:D-3-phosphoglycerate dehydrogenase